MRRIHELGAQAVMTCAIPDLGFLQHMQACDTSISSGNPTRSTSGPPRMPHISVARRRGPACENLGASVHTGSESRDVAMVPFHLMFIMKQDHDDKGTVCVKEG